MLALLPIELVAIEKVLLATLRALTGGAFIFPLAYLILGSAFQVRADLIGVLIGLMALVAPVGAAIGLLFGTSVRLFHRRVIS
ncbi:MAG TPA: hypothetical protein VKV20_20450 [Ktedonobacteraceae bacterium]|nr:hypothetical protein [Ktedonobacteraceae bacterium]